jgi:hypothetical protein
LDYTTHAAAEGLGIIGKAGRGRGICLHTTLALRVNAWDLEQQPETTVMGLFGPARLVAKTLPERRNPRPACVEEKSKLQTMGRSFSKLGQSGCRQSVGLYR